MHKYYHQVLMYNFLIIRVELTVEQGIANEPLKIQYLFLMKNFTIIVRMCSEARPLD